MQGKKAMKVFLFLCCVMLASASAAWAGPDRLPSVPAYQNNRAEAPAGQQLTPQVPLSPEAMTSSASQEYVLGVGDRIKLTVYGEGDLSGDYDVGSTGIIALPLIGDIQAAGHPIRAFENAVRGRLAQGYLRDPRVSAQVINYRPFFILGEVAKPGSYPYVNGMSILNAVALAGGYSYRADKSDVKLTRANDPARGEISVPETAVVMPGDIIRVPERFF